MQFGGLKVVKLIVLKFFSIQLGREGRKVNKIGQDEKQYINYYFAKM